MFYKSELDFFYGYSQDWDQSLSVNNEHLKNVFSFWKTICQSNI